MANIQLIQGDCIGFMKSLPDKSFQLAIVDPPYGINAPNMTMGENINRNDGSRHKESTANRIKKGRLNQGGGQIEESDFKYYELRMGHG